MAVARQQDYACVPRKNTCPWYIDTTGTTLVEIISELPPKSEEKSGLVDHTISCKPDT